jgi:hypothetical protein
MTYCKGINNSVRGTIIFLILFFAFTDSRGQDFPSEMLHEGELVLLNGDTLRGQIKYNLENDLIQMVINETVQTYSARKILYFSIYDKSVDMHRNFYSIPFEVQPNYKIPILFEVLYEGKLSLLAREVVVTETVPQYSYMYRSSVNMTRTRLDYEYYFLAEKGNIIKYNNKKYEIFEVMKRKEPQIKQYIKKNKLKIDSRRDLVRITAYYNALLGQK